jgi:hypothetical protein
LTLAVGAFSACEQTKSENPLSPLIAGPMANVDITTPILLEPEMGRKYKPEQQPLTLLLENPSSNSPRPFTFLIEVASDSTFTSMVFAKNGVTPGTTNGRTTYRLPEALAPGRTYYWRAKAMDGANASAFSTPRPFEILEPVVIGPPNPVSPAGGIRTTTRRPALLASNAPTSRPHGQLIYIFEVSLDSAFSSRVVLEQAEAGSSQTALAIPHDLAVNTLHFWRARVTNGEVTGSWSKTESFLTPLAVVAPPPGGGGGGGGTGGGGSCASSDGNSIVNCIMGKYPSYLAAGVSTNQREANMEFLRDRVIEAGICGGLDLAWNKKRGNGPHSIDALAWRTGGRDEVVDIGAAYDDTSISLRLQWGIVAGPPGYDTYSPRPTCGG